MCTSHSAVSDLEPGLLLSAAATLGGGRPLWMTRHGRPGRGDPEPFESNPCFGSSAASPRSDHSRSVDWVRERYLRRGARNTGTSSSTNTFSTRYATRWIWCAPRCSRCRRSGPGCGGGRGQCAEELVEQLVEGLAVRPLKLLRVPASAGLGAFRRGCGAEGSYSAGLRGELLRVRDGENVARVGPGGDSGGPGPGGEVDAQPGDHGVGAGQGDEADDVSRRRGRAARRSGRSGVLGRAVASGDGPEIRASMVCRGATAIELVTDPKSREQLAAIIMAPDAVAEAIAYALE